RQHCWPPRVARCFARLEKWAFATPRSRARPAICSSSDWLARDDWAPRTSAPTISRSRCSSTRRTRLAIVHRRTTALLRRRRLRSALSLAGRSERDAAGKPRANPDGSLEVIARLQDLLAEVER